MAILADIPGPKLRIGPMAGGVAELGRGSRVVLTPSDVEGTAERLPVAWQGLAELVHEGDVCYLADGAVRLRVDGISDGEVLARVEVGGIVASRQGINLPNVTVSLPAVSEKDIELIDASLDMGVDAVALSFVRRREDLEPVRAHLRERDSDLPLIAKVEKPQAAANAEEIVDAADGIMVARGDLGIELPIEEVPLVQKRLLALAGHRAKPTITATQMLESMVQSSRPTRAEVADVANAIFDGTDAVMLSQETAVGQNPVAAVEMMAAIAVATERELPYGRWLAERGEGEQPVPRDRLRGRGRRLPARAQGDRLPDELGRDRALDLRLPPQGAGAGAVTPPRDRSPLLSPVGGPGALHEEVPDNTIDLLESCAHAAVEASWPTPGTRSASPPACRPARPAAPTCSRCTGSSNRGDPAKPGQGAGEPRGCSPGGAPAALLASYAVAGLCRSRYERAFSTFPQASMVHQRLSGSSSGRRRPTGSCAAGRP